jgi:PleD family two-component response regulator
MAGGTVAQELKMPTSNQGSGGKRSRQRDSTEWRGRPPLTVLIVDGDSQRAQQLAEWLQPMCLVAIVPSARHAASIIGQRTPDLIITDLDLPDLSGIEYLAYLTRSPATHHILRMVVTSKRGVHDKIEALRAGADEYVVWPCDREFFVLRVRLLSRFRRML